MEENRNEPPSKFMNKVIFIFFGIASLLGWNALLTKLDFFFYFLSDINPYRSFSFLNYFLNITFQFILIWKKNLMPLKPELITGILGSIVFLILLPLSASQLGQNEMKNKVITAGLIVLMGFINALASGGFFGYAGHFPLEMIVLFTVGQGLSAVLMNILEYIVLASVHIKGDEEKEIVVRAWIFFVFGILILLVCLFLLLYSYKDEYCQYYLNKGNRTNVKESEQLSLISADGNSNNFNEDEKNQQVANRAEDNITIKTEPSFSYVFKKLMEFDILACYGYIVTFGLFPNICIAQKIFSLGDYNSVTIITIYNVFDTIGRYLVKLFTPTKIKNRIIVIGRSILFFTLIFNDYCQVELKSNLTFTSIFLMVNVAILGITNGMGATLTFGLASDIAEDEIKKQTGGSIGFFSILGIFLGSCLAFGTGAITDSYR